MPKVSSFRIVSIAERLDQLPALIPPALGQGRAPTAPGVASVGWARTLLPGDESIRKHAQLHRGRHGGSRGTHTEK